MRLSELIVATKGVLNGPDCEFDRISIDSRTIERGELFVALRGKNFDGHAFVESALVKGACGFVVDTNIDSEKLKGKEISQLIVVDTTKALGEIAHEKRKNYAGKIVAITGSCGKTSVKEMLAAICHVGDQR